ncbi:MAG: antitoxin Xre/MbcA/ParS toxin-binding domain-containing protein [Gemmatimonadota bacterium]
MAILNMPYDTEDSMTSAVAAKLGGRRILRREVGTEIELAEVVRAGLPAKALDHLLAEFSKFVSRQTEVFRVVGSARTLQRKRSRGTRLSAEESDRLARLARMLVRAESALGLPERAGPWLVTPNRALGGRSPLSLLDSDAGTLAVDQVLGRIEHGVYS